jgi:preprotein translocase subunit SecG
MRRAVVRTVLLLGAAAAPPLLSGGARAAAPPAATCPPAAAPAAGSQAGGTQVAGYDLTAQATGARYDLASPGLLPVGDPHEGTVMELDVPLARGTVSEGPVIDSLGSPAYPGDTAAHLGTAVATFGGPALPNDPAVAEATYPPSPGHGGGEQFGPSGGGAGAGAATATAGADGATAQSTAASTSFSPSGSTPAVAADSSTTTTHLDVGTRCVSAAATASSGAVDLAGGLVHIAGVSGTAAARSDGTRGVPDAHLAVGKVTVGGLAAFIDHDGIHLAGQQAVGYGVVAQVQATLNNALHTFGLAVKLIDPVTTVGAGAASADSGGLEVTIDRQLPATGVPGVPAISIPGQPPVPVGTPPAPLHIEVVYGGARVSAEATTAPAFTSLPTPALPPPAATAGTGSSALAAAGPDLGAGSLTSPAATTGGISGPGVPPSLQPVRATSGVPAPVGWIIAGVLASLVLAGPLFGYARWQLLEGRI